MSKHTELVLFQLDTWLLYFDSASDTTTSLLYILKVIVYCVTLSDGMFNSLIVPLREAFPILLYKCILLQFSPFIGQSSTLVELEVWWREKKKKKKNSSLWVKRHPLFRQWRWIKTWVCHWLQSASAMEDSSKAARGRWEPGCYVDGLK